MHRLTPSTSTYSFREVHLKPPPYSAGSLCCSEGIQLLLWLEEQEVLLAPNSLQACGRCRPSLPPTPEEPEASGDGIFSSGGGILLFQEAFDSIPSFLRQVLLWPRCLLAAGWLGSVWHLSLALCSSFCLSSCLKDCARVHPLIPAFWKAPGLFLHVAKGNFGLRLTPSRFNAQATLMGFS